MTVYDLPIRHPERKKTRIRPLKALHHMRKLIADKEDTDQVFEIIDALNGNAFDRYFEKFAATENGQKRIAERRYLAPILDSRREELLRYPQGTLGRTYAEFMQREGLTAMGLVEESQKRDSYVQYDDMLNWLGNRLRDTHDMFHVLSGYGRDGMGEAILLGFTNHQHYGLDRGVSFIHYMGGRQIKKELPKSFNIDAVMREGRENGAAAKPIMELDILGALDRPIADVRKELNISLPVKYYAALRKIVANDLKAEHIGQFKSSLIGVAA